MIALQTAGWYIVWQKAVFITTRDVILWIFLAFIGFAIALWYLAIILDKHNAPRLTEASFARKAAVTYTAAALLFWLLGFILG